MNATICVRNRRRCRAIGLAVTALTIYAALGHPAAAGFAAVEPELSATAQMPGMPPAPDMPQLRWQAPASASAASAQPDAAATAKTAPAVASSEPPNAGGISVVRWGIGPSLGSGAGEVAAGQPLYLWMTIAGGQAAIDRLSAGAIPIDVHWNRIDAGAAVGAPNLTTHLAIGQPALAPTLAGEVQRQGHFEWHSWARKDSLSPGAWIVSLTHPDGQPLMCGTTAPRPCRFSVTIG
jgi:hypothetical protein